MSTETTERGETVSLHERLREAAKSTLLGDTSASYNHVERDDLAAIEAAIREDAIAPLRERIQRQALAIAEEREEHDALKARADALLGSANALAVQSGPRTGVKMETWFAYQDAFRSAVRDYDAADRAGETQVSVDDEGRVSFQCPPNCEACEAEREMTAPSPTDAAAVDERRYQLLIERVTDLERWREDMNTYRNKVIDEIAQLDARVSLNQLEANTALRELRTALEARQGGVPEVTDAMLTAYGEVFYGAKVIPWGTGERDIVREGLAAALAVMGGGR